MTPPRWTEAVPDSQRRVPRASFPFGSWTRICQRAAVLGLTVFIGLTTTTFAWLDDPSRTASTSPPGAVSPLRDAPGIDLAGLLKETDSIAAAGSRQPQLHPAPDYRPVNGRVTSGFANWRLHPVIAQVRPHRGVDIAAPWGSPIRAPADGVVSSVSYDPTYGKMVTVVHDDSLLTRYAHCSMVLVRPGQRIQRGYVLALVGESGLTTGPHLHYEVVVHGRHLDPLCRPWGSAQLAVPRCR